MIRITVDGTLTAMISNDRLTVLNGILLPGADAHKTVDLPQDNGSTITFNPNTPTGDGVAALLRFLHPSAVVEVEGAEPAMPPTSIDETGPLPELPLRMPSIG